MANFFESLVNSVAETPYIDRPAELDTMANQSDARIAQLRADRMPMLEQQRDQALLDRSSAYAADARRASMAGLAQNLPRLANRANRANLGATLGGAFTQQGLAGQLGASQDRTNRLAAASGGAIENRAQSDQNLATSANLNLTKALADAENRSREQGAALGSLLNAGSAFMTGADFMKTMGWGKFAPGAGNITTPKSQLGGRVMQ